MPPSVTIISHTTASVPRPHILYSVQVNIGGKRRVVDKRYSEVGRVQSLNDLQLTISNLEKSIFSGGLLPADQSG